MRMSPVRFFSIPTGLSIIQRGFAHAAIASEKLDAAQCSADAEAP